MCGGGGSRSTKWGIDPCTIYMISERSTILTMITQTGVGVVRASYRCVGVGVVGTADRCVCVCMCVVVAVDRCMCVLGAADRYLPSWVLFYIFTISL